MKESLSILAIPTFNLTKQRMNILKRKARADKHRKVRKADVISALRKYRGFGSRLDVNTLTIRDVEYYITGGMTLSDSPTHAYDTFLILSQFWQLMEHWAKIDAGIIHLYED